jgi:protein gp37
MLPSKLKFAAELSHIWWGVSVENRKHGLPRIKHLRAAKPAMAILSIEPLLEDIGDLNLSGIDWVIVGGESGHGARPMKSEWVINIQRQCSRFRVPFFFKQWGGVHKSRAGRELNGRTFDEKPRIASDEVLCRAERQALVGRFSVAWPRGIARGSRPATVSEEVGPAG